MEFSIPSPLFESSKTPPESNNETMINQIPQIRKRKVAVAGGQKTWLNEETRWFCNGLCMVIMVINGY